MITPSKTNYRPETKPPYFEVDFHKTPFTIAWEITRACALNCLHCRAEAQHRRDPRELTRDEGFALIDQIAEIGHPILVITGGDPMMRRDVYDFISYAVQKGLRTALSPSATRLVTRQALQRVKEAGISMIHVSLDGSTPEIHDAFRGFSGSYQRTLEILHDILDLDVPLQIGTTVSRYNLDDLPAIAERIAEMGITVWSVFFLVPAGRGKAEDMISARQHEEVFHWLYDLSQKVPFHIRTTAAQHYRRVVIQRTREVMGISGETSGESAPLELTGAGYSFRQGKAAAGKGVNDGNGFCFISHIGDVWPSGFLQITAGNIRKQPLAEIYRHSPLFCDLRDENKLKGKCGACEFKTICGGSRARAYAMSGDYLATDPSCIYIPPAL